MVGISILTLSQRQTLLLGWHSGLPSRGTVVRRLLFGSVSALVLIFAAAQPAKAADLAPHYKAPAPLWSWAGFYVGVHSGAMFSGTKFSDPFGSSLYGDVVDVPGAFRSATTGWSLRAGSQASRWMAVSSA